MAEIKIYSPPIITAKGNVKLGHGSNLVWCDVLARCYAENRTKIDYHFPAWNHQGKMFDHMANTKNLKQKLLKIEEEFSKKLSLFGLKGYEEYRDTSEKSRINSKERFKELMEKGFITLVGEEYFLRIDKIRKNTNLVDNISEASYFPRSSKKRMLDLVTTLSDSYPISKPRDFATPVPNNEGSQQKINPIFDLAVSPFIDSKGPVDYSIDGVRTMLHGTFIPFVISSGLFNEPFSRNVALHGFLLTDYQEQELMKLHQRTNQDVIRGLSLLGTFSLEDTKLNRTRERKVVKATSKLIKLAWFFKNFSPLYEKFAQPVDSSVREGITQMRHAKVMDHLMEKIFSFSGRLSEKCLSKDNYSEYLSLLNNCKVFFH